MNPTILSSIIDRLLPEPHASLLNGITYGLPIQANTQFYQDLKMVGLLHLVVLSGMNITLLTAMFMIFTRNFGRKLSVLITILLIILFVLFVRPQAPVIRASFICIITLVSFMFGRKTIGFYSLFLSFIFISFFWPNWITTVSFNFRMQQLLDCSFLDNLSTFKKKKAHMNYSRMCVQNSKLR